VTVRLGPRGLAQALTCLTISHGTAQDSHCPSLTMRESWGRAPSSSGEGLSPRVLELAMRVEGEESPSLYKRGLEFGAWEPSC
jgi:hypothetical protein